MKWQRNLPGRDGVVAFNPVPETLNKSPKVSTAARPAGARKSRAGLLFGLSAYTIWGFIPIYFHAVSQVPPLIVLCHRILWSALFMAVVVSVRREWKPLGPVLRRGRNVALLSAGAILIAANWLIFIYSVATRQLLQASLGYFINPLLSIALGMIFLRERLRGWQWLAVGVAGCGVVNLALRGDGFPWIAVSLACSFGFYGLVRKAVDINSLHGLTIESAILVPAAAAGLIWLTNEPISRGTFGLLSLSGVITAVPLLFFGAALRRLQLSTVGFLQYVGPTLQFLVACCLFHEPLDQRKLASFGLCWLAIAVYVADSLINRRAQIIADEPE